MPSKILLMGSELMISHVMRSWSYPSGSSSSSAACEKGQVAGVVAERGYAHDGPPVAVVVLPRGRDVLTHRIGDLVRPGDDVVDPAGEMHDAERMLEAFVGCAGINLVGERQLVDVPQALKGRTVDDRSLVVVEVDEYVDRSRTSCSRLAMGASCLVCTPSYDQSAQTNICSSSSSLGPDGRRQLWAICPERSVSFRTGDVWH